MPPANKGDQLAARDALPHAAEDLSADDDLLSWVLVDQLGCMPNTKLGVHPQQVKFVGPAFKTDEVLNIVRETVTKGNLQSAMQRLQEFHLFQQHLASKMTAAQRDRFIQHLRRYLLPLLPNSRLEIHLTSRYTFVTGHAELAVFATRPLAAGVVMQELQGSVVPLPDEWREEMEIGEDFAVEAAGEETDSESEDETGDGDTESMASSRRDKGKAREERRQGQRRSDRTKRRDFSIVWSGLKRCYQLFLGPARFLNHDCDPNVELLRQGKYVTFRVTRPVKIGEELTTFYGDNYFGKSNMECLCLTCEQNQRGGFAPKPVNTSRSASRHSSRDTSRAPSLSRRTSSPRLRESVSRENRSVGPSSLRHQVKEEEMSEDEGEVEDAAGATKPAAADEQEEDSEVEEPIDFSPEGAEGTEGTASVLDAEGLASQPDTPAKPRRGRPSQLALSPTSGSFAEAEADSAASEPDSPSPSPPRRERRVRKAAQKTKPWAFLQRAKKMAKEEEETTTETTEEFSSDFPRCATCAKPLTEQIWFNGRYFDHCQRCVRHALVFDLPWPAHRPQDVQEYPPAHLIPSGYIPRKISTVQLPSLSKTPRAVKPVEVPTSPANETQAERRARRLRNELIAEEFFIESLREAAWSVQEAKEAAQEAKEEEKRRAREEKKKKDQAREKGSGVWQRYEFVSEDELIRREEERFKVQPGVTRRGTVRRRQETSSEEDEDGGDDEEKASEDDKEKDEQEATEEEKKATGRADKGKGMGKEKAQPRIPTPPVEEDDVVANEDEDDADVEDEITVVPAYSPDMPESSTLPTPVTGSTPRQFARRPPPALPHKASPAKATNPKVKPTPKASIAPTSRNGNPIMLHIPARKQAVTPATTDSESAAGDRVRRPRGRPPGTGKLQRRAAAEAAIGRLKEDSSDSEDVLGGAMYDTDRKVSSTSISSSGSVVYPRKNSADSKGKGKAAALNPILPNGQKRGRGRPRKIMAAPSTNHVIASGIELPSHSTATSNSSSSRKSAAFLGETARAVAVEVHAGPSSPHTDAYPVLGGILLPPSHTRTLEDLSVSSASAKAGGASLARTPDSAGDAKGRHVSGTKVVISPGSRDKGKPTALKSWSGGGVEAASSSPDVGREGNSKKRTLDSSGDSSSSPAQPPRKKRTFFPSVISVTVFKPNGSSPVAAPRPTHSISQ